MCREKGRRCPCDTSAARQARRVNTRSRDSVKNVQSPAQSFTPTHTYYDGYTPTGNHSEDITALQEKLASIHVDDEIPRKHEGESTADYMSRLQHSNDQTKKAEAERDKISQEIGNKVSLLAEEKAGFTHADMEDQLAKCNATQDEYDKSVSQLMAYTKKDDTDPQKEEELRQRVNELAKQNRQAENEFKKTSEQMGNAYKEAVAFASGEELGAGEQGLTLTSHATKKHKEAAKVLEEDLDCYPRSWIEASNERGDLLPRFSTRRAHYDEGRMVISKRRVVPRIVGDLKPDEEHKYEPLTDEEKEALGTKDYSQYDLKHMYKEVRWTHYNHFEHGELGENGMPPGRGWQKKTIWQRDWSNYDEEKYVQKEVIMRRRPVRNTANDRKERVAEITIPEHTSWGDKGVQRAAKEDRSNHVSIHEFAHRCESTIPQIVRMENRFLMRRKGEDEKLVKIYKTGPSEKAYADSFSETYSGKVYDGSSYEIMSMGTEALMGRHTNGRIDDTTPMWSQEGKMDTDYRDFVLGVLSTVKPKK